jgi:hypothetical protein
MRASWLACCARSPAITPPIRSIADRACVVSALRLAYSVRNQRPRAVAVTAAQMAS